MTKWQWTFNGESSPRQFGTQKELMEALGVSNMTIRDWLRRGYTGDADLSPTVKHKVGLSVTWLHLNTDKRLRDITIEELQDIGDGEQVTYVSINQLAKSLNTPPSTVQGWIARGYTSSRDVVVEQYKRGSKGSIVYEGVEYVSVSHMARALGITDYKVAQLINGNAHSESRKEKPIKTPKAPKSPTRPKPTRKPVASKDNDLTYADRIAIIRARHKRALANLAEKKRNEESC